MSNQNQKMCAVNQQTNERTTANQSITQSLNHSRIQRVQHLIFTQSLNHPITNHPITQSPNHPITQSLNHSITPSLNHSITQSLNHSITQSLNHSLTQPINHSVQQAIKPASQPHTSPPTRLLMSLRLEARKMNHSKKLAWFTVLRFRAI